MTTRGLVLGKFMPPHLGHLRLFEFASRWVDEVVIVVGTRPGEPIDGDRRGGWVRALAPTAQVLRLHADLPQLPEEHPRFWELWRSALLDLLGEAPTHVLAGEDYGARLAAELGVLFVPLDRGDGALEISATEIRRDPARHWDELPRIVRRDLVRRVHVVGPESTGKTTLARALAGALDCPWVPEYARTWLTRPGVSGDAPEVCEADLEAIARGHAASADAVVSLGRHPLAVLDTDSLCTAFWSKHFLGRVPPGVRAAEAAESPAFTLLTAPDLPWEGGPLRYMSGAGEEAFDRLRGRVEAAGRAHAVVRGSGPARLACALDALASAGLLP